MSKTQLQRAVLRGMQVVKALEAYRSLPAQRPYSRLTDQYALPLSIWAARTIVSPLAFTWHSKGLVLVFGFMCGAGASDIGSDQSLGFALGMAFVILIALAIGLMRTLFGHHEWEPSWQKITLAPCLAELNFKLDEACAHGIRGGVTRKTCEPCTLDLEAQYDVRKAMLIRATTALDRIEREEAAQEQARMEREQERQAAEAKARVAAREERKRQERERHRQAEATRREEQKRRREKRLRYHQDLETLRRMDPYKFESLVADIYTQLGYKTRVTPQSSDSGVDVWAERRGQKIAIQCKRNGASTRVGAPEVQQLHGAAACGDAQKSVLVTTSDFTKGAYQTAGKLGIELINSRTLIQMIRKLAR